MVELRTMESRILGDYNVIKQIGQGSLGAVYLAEHRFMKQQYVLKVLPEELSSDRSFIQRFEEEVALLAALEHPNIVRIYNISFAQGQYFLVTDCIVDELGETTNLAQYMLARSKRLDEEELYQMLRQLADALDYAHGKKMGSKGIVHRGIKLNNILVGQEKNRPHLYFSDFGLSKIVGSGAVLSRTYKLVADALGANAVVAASKSGQDRYPNPPLDNQKLIPLHASFLQNYAFLAPEQKRLDYPKGIDAKADTYAFGVLAYYLLVGEFPEGFFEMPSERVPEYSWDWDTLVKDCLRSDPIKRPDLLLPVLDNLRKGLRAAHIVFKEDAPSIARIETPVQPAIIQHTSSAAIQHHPHAPTQISPPVPVKPVQLENPKLAEVLPKKDTLSSPEALKPILHVAQLERPQVDPDPGAVFQLDNTVKQYTPEHKEVKNIQPLLTDMAIIPGGTFWRGSNDGNRDEMPRHQVTLASYAIDKHPVTNEQFVRFLEAMGGEKDSNHHDIIRMRDSRIKRSGGKLSIESGYAKHPVVGVTWYGAIAYAKWVGKRLPSEAEWEIAARGAHDNALYPTGDDIEKTQANFFSSDTTAVMSYASNGYGLFDMAGNVYEWVHDWYGYNYYETSVQEPENPLGPLQGVYRVLRGGCWKSLKEDLRCSRRHRNNPGTVNGTYGFRCAADVG